MGNPPKTRASRLHPLSLKGAAFFVLLLCGVVAYVSPLRPAFDKLAILHLDDCALPCWIGIVPGQSNLAEARELIRIRYPAEDFDIEVADVNPEWTSDFVLRVIDKHAPRYIGIVLNDYVPGDDTNESIIRTVHLSIFNMTDKGQYVPKVIDWMDVLGEPACVWEEWGNHKSWPALAYPQTQANISVWSDGLRVAPDMGAGLLLADQAADCHPESNTPWQGFSIDYQVEFSKRIG